MSTVLQRIQAGRLGYLADLLDQVDERWRSEFERFVETGEAGEEFLSYLDQHTGAQEAVQTAFERQAAKFEEFASELQRRREAGDNTPEVQVSPPASTTSVKVAEVVENALQATSARRDEVVANGTADLARSISAEQVIEVKEVLKSMEEGLAQAAEANS
jgi:hypothetical protein